MDQRQSHEDGLLAELAASVPLADPTVVALVRELTAEISRLQSAYPDPVGEASATVESLTGLLLGQAAELQELRDRLQRVWALIDLSRWAAAANENPADPAIRASDILHAIAGPVAERPS